ncbi:MAG TPA: 30S ribosomal protein S9 [Phycisphaerae bacterium]|nr:30S ribosomal protein S9 [Phycisphaerae bacterium]HOQ85852.1 30S ribosomal protein S9 [Phycisphaerae bacterium]HPP27824.1 30S ribosomal protein S9 [Phycisphaerae bacterium]HPU27199.1 30S ribosomal protein S9 [Phycisphaerae bacterium]HQE28166.1 30S ribosomal protein S9 [Phycisphaerae bacterium]
MKENQAVSATIPEPDPKQHYFWGTGRRKTAVARVRLRPGTGKFEINRRPLESYFTEERDRNDCTAPLRATETLGKVDVFVNVKGGGITGQAGAVVLGVARALKKANPQYDAPLRQGGYLTRDAREVERKKYGKAGARRSFQFSKR